MASSDDPREVGQPPSREEAGGDFATELVEVDQALIAATRFPDAQATPVGGGATEHEQPAASLRNIGSFETNEPTLPPGTPAARRTVGNRGSRPSDGLSQTIDDPDLAAPQAGLPSDPLPLLPQAGPTDSLGAAFDEALPTILGMNADATSLDSLDEDDPPDETLQALPQLPAVVPSSPIGKRQTEPEEEPEERTIRNAKEGRAVAALVDDLVISGPRPLPDEDYASPDDPWSEATALDEDDEPTLSRRDSDIQDMTVRQVSLPPQSLASSGDTDTTRALVQQLFAVKDTDGISFGPYSLIGTIGTGGMAEVRLALEEKPGAPPRPCVVKRISKAHLGRADYRQMFMEEARIGRLLDHPNIVQLFDAGELDGTPYIAFELVDGITAAYIEKLGHQQVPASVVVELGISVARGLGYAHALCASDGTPLSLVHRDVSPQNILIRRNGDVKLADFGIARFEGREHETKIGLIKGKMRYLAPEQIRMERVDARTDLFSLGVVLAELLSGEPLFPGSVFVIDNAAEHIREALTPPKSSAPPALISLLVRMTADRRDARPDYAESVMRELRSIQLGLAERITLADYLDREVFTRLPGVREQALAHTRRRAKATDWVVPTTDSHPTPASPTGPPDPMSAVAAAPPADSDDDAGEAHYPTSIGLLFPDLFGSRVGAFTGVGAIEIPPDDDNPTAPPGDANLAAERLRMATLPGRGRAPDTAPPTPGAIPVVVPIAAARDPAAPLRPGSVEMVRPVASVEIESLPSPAIAAGTSRPQPRTRAENVVIILAVVALIVAAVVVFIDYTGL